MKVTIFGAARGVTGSCFLVETASTRFLIDCGLFQGDDELRNFNSFPHDVRSIDAVILTHAHLDHSGRLPLLCKQGFRGPIYCTAATRDLVRIMLLDAAKVMQEDHAVKLRKAVRRGEKVPDMLYDQDDVNALAGHLKAIPYNESTPLGADCSFTLCDAGHVLGSCFVELAIDEDGTRKRVVFSGDLGNRNKPIIHDPVSPADADYVFMETTYGDRDHKSFDDSKSEFRDAIGHAFSRNGTVYIPSFALERSQEIIYMLRDLYDEGNLPPCRVYLDSPLAIAATNIFKQHREYFDDEAQALLRAGHDPFYFPYLMFTRNVEESKAINNYRERAIIIAGSGMCNGGRILHHLKHGIWNDRNAIVFLGFQAQGTIGRRIIDGARMISIYGEALQVAAKVFTINGFSSHADRGILRKWLSRMPSAKKVFLIHGEPESMGSFKDYVGSGCRAEIVMPDRMQEIVL